LGALGAGAVVASGASSLGTTPVLAQAPAAAPARVAPPVITRTIGRTNETVTALGLGTFLTFDALPGQNRDALREVTKRYFEGGGRVIDTSPLYGTGEVSVGAFLAALGANNDVFISNKIWSTGEYLGDESHALRSLEQSKLRLWRGTLDVLHCHSLVNANAIVPLLGAWKKEGRIRYVGVSHHENAAHDALTEQVESGAVDFVQVNYSIFSRGAEQRLLPAAADKGVAVLINLPLEKARLMKVVEGRPLPAFASEFGATTWSQFFLKWVMANPAVTTVLCGTSNPDHASENIGALRGPLPDQAMRQRMVRHMETIPGFGEIARMPWYPDKQAQYQGAIRQAQAQLRQRS
jgi:diketogulonate reductase-like aldo/keto reductase